MIHWTLIIVVSGMFAYALFADEIEEELPPQQKTKKKPVRVKRNGRWVDEEQYK